MVFITGNKPQLPYFTHKKTQTANMANHLAQANGRVKTRSINSVMMEMFVFFFALCNMIDNKAIEHLKCD